MRESFEAEVFRASEVLGRHEDPRRVPVALGRVISALEALVAERAASEVIPPAPTSPDEWWRQRHAGQSVGGAMERPIINRLPPFFREPRSISSWGMFE